MDISSTVSRIFNEIRQDANKVPRDYPTIGSFWTVDTWKKDGVTVQLEDEGYTQAVLTDAVQVRVTYNRDPVFYRGTEEDLAAIAQALKLLE